MTRAGEKLYIDVRKGNPALRFDTPSVGSVYSKSSDLDGESRSPVPLRKTSVECLLYSALAATRTPDGDVVGEKGVTYALYLREPLGKPT